MLGGHLADGLGVGGADAVLANAEVILGRLQLVEGWGRDEEDLGVVGGNVGVGDDGDKVLLVLV